MISNSSEKDTVLSTASNPIATFKRGEFRLIMGMLSGYVEAIVQFSGVTRIVLASLDCLDPIKYAIPGYVVSDEGMGKLGIAVAAMPKSLTQKHAITISPELIHKSNHPAIVREMYPDIRTSPRGSTSRVIEVTCNGRGVITQADATSTSTVKCIVEGHALTDDGLIWMNRVVAKVINEGWAGLAMYVHPDHIRKLDPGEVDTWAAPSARSLISI